MTLQDERRLGRLWALDSVNLVPISKGYINLAISNTVVNLPPLHANTTHIFWTLDGADIRVTFDATEPPAMGGQGHLFADGGSGVWPREMAQVAHMIRNAGVDATLRVTQLKRMNT